MEGILARIILFPFYFLKIFFKAQIDSWRYILDHKTAQKITEIKDVDFKNVAEITTKNVEKFFSVKF